MIARVGRHRPAREEPPRHAPLTYTPRHAATPPRAVRGPGTVTIYDHPTPPAVIMVGPPWAPDRWRRRHR